MTLKNIAERPTINEATAKALTGLKDNKLKKNIENIKNKVPMPSQPSLYELANATKSNKVSLFVRFVANAILNIWCP